MKSNNIKTSNERNKKIIDMVLERIERDFKEDIAIVGLTGSYAREDYHEKSDLDLIIVNDTDRAWEMASCFILDDIGFDIYCTSWHPRLEDQANLKSFAAGSLLDLQIIYVRDDEAEKKYRALQERAQKKLDEPIGKSCLDRAQVSFDKTKKYYADMLIKDGLNDVRFASSSLLFEAINTIVSANNTYIKRGTLQYLEELKTYKYLPQNFEELYHSVIKASDVSALRETANQFMKALDAFMSQMNDQFIEKPQPTHDNLKDMYEELWCNCRNKLIRAAELNNLNYSIHVANGAQSFLDFLHGYVGSRKYQLMKNFDGENMAATRDMFIEIMEDFEAEYKKVGREIKQYDDFQALYDDYMCTDK